MEQPFATEELKEELERALGFRLRELTRLDGASALNFKAVRETDGMTFAVKCSPFDRQVMFDHLTENLKKLEGSKAVRRIFERECPPTFRGCNVVCMTWCGGERLFPDRLTREQLAVFMDDYLEFSKAMQRVENPYPATDLRLVRQALLLSFTGFWGGLLRRFVDREIAEDSVVYRPELMRTVHSDFHHGNFLFVDGRVNGYLDLEEFRKGYPAEDIMRYFICAAEHLRWYELHRLRRILACFEQAVRQMPFAKEEWLLAVNGRFLTKVGGITCGKRIGPFRYLNLVFKARFYRRLRNRLADIRPEEAR